MNPIKYFKQIITYFPRRWKYEQHERSKTRFLITCIYALLFSLLTVMLEVGRLLMDKVLIINPIPTKLSSESLNAIELFVNTTNLFFILGCLSLLIIAYKYYQEFNAKKIIEKYQLDVIE